MSKKPDKLLFVTSFVPVAAFKTIARLGEATWGQARTAVLVGLILAAIQYVSARKVLHYNTFVESLPGISALARSGFIPCRPIWPISSWTIP